MVKQVIPAISVYLHTNFSISHL